MSVIAIILSIASLCVSIFAFIKGGKVGPKGDKGDKGDRGLKGAKGDKGDKGDDGNIINVDITDIPFITVKDNLLKVNGKIEATKGFYNKK